MDDRHENEILALMRLEQYNYQTALVRTNEWLNELAILANRHKISCFGEEHPLQYNLDELHMLPCNLRKLEGGEQWRETERGQKVD